MTGPSLTSFYAGILNSFGASDSLSRAAEVIARSGPRPCRCLLRFIDFRVKMPKPTSESDRNQTPSKSTITARTIAAIASTASTMAFLSFVRCRK